MQRSSDVSHEKFVGLTKEVLRFLSHDSDMTILHENRLELTIGNWQGEHKVAKHGHDH